MKNQKRKAQECKCQLLFLYKYSKVSTRLVITVKLSGNENVVKSNSTTITTQYFV